MKTIRCAIYTRKSNDEGLEKEFNTLEAQREAGENYVRAQVYQGWKLIEKRYDDGGYSGGNMKRPALQELLKDIKAGEVDMIVVYKIDRLSRSLMDFSQMINIFDKYNCSFTSVTQNFNTADSTGRLMLNVLLSFAQFEREISGERIRDKIAATRKKGIWTGGHVPFGYQVINKKLVIYPPHAKIVKHIFERYAEIGSETQLTQELNELKLLDLSNKKYRNFSKLRPASITQIIKNPTYIGKLKFKGELYDGVHEPIITKELFKKVDAIKTKKQRLETPETNEMLNGLLKNLLYCGYCNQPFDITYTKRKGFRYKYYICRNASTMGHKSCHIGQINAGELEALILQSIKPLFTNPNLIQEIANETKQVSIAYQEPEVFNAMHSFEKVFQDLTLSGQQEVLRTVISKIIILKETVIIQFFPQIAEILSAEFKGKFNYGTYDLEIPYQKRNRNGKTYIVNAEGKAITQISPDKTLLKALIRSFQWTKLMHDKNLTQQELAEQMNIDRGYLGKIMRLSILAPDIVQAILDGKQPSHLTVDTFMRTTIPYRWNEQRIKFGF